MPPIRTRLRTIWIHAANFRAESGDAFGDREWHTACDAARMTLRARVTCVAALALIVAPACGASDETSSESESEQDEAWGEMPFGKADGASSEAEIAARKELVSKFREPALTAEEREAVLARYADVDSSAEMPRALLEDALVYYDVNLALLENARYLTVIDFSQHSSKRRLYIVDMQSGTIERHVVAHGSGSDPDNTGTPTAFSNMPNSHQSSLGFYLTAETYSGSHGLSLRLDGLSDTNSKVRERAIVLHGANYVVDGRSKQGRSWGCPAVPMTEKNAIIDKLEAGSLMYAERSAD